MHRHGHGGCSQMHGDQRRGGWRGAHGQGHGRDGAARRTGAVPRWVEGRAHTGTDARAGMCTSSRGSAETSLTPAASSCAIVLGDQPVNATGMVAGTGAGMGAGTGAGVATVAASSFWAMSMRPHSSLFSISSGSELTSPNLETSGR